MAFKIHVIDVQNNLQNYIWLIEDIYSKNTVVIDPTEADLVIAHCQKFGLNPTQIWLTHWHKDHVGGVPTLKLYYPSLEIYAPQKEQHRLPFESTALKDSSHFNFEQLNINVIETIGHTLGHIVYFVPQLESLFVGDTLFAMGCGRVFEGTHQQMFQAMQKFNTFANTTKIYCAHEYTYANSKFALSIEPDNYVLQERAEQIEYMHLLHQNTLPTTIGLEKQTNPFLRAKTAEEFSRIRILKDIF